MILQKELARGMSVIDSDLDEEAGDSGESFEDIHVWNDYKSWLIYMLHAPFSVSILLFLAK